MKKITAFLLLLFTLSPLLCGAVSTSGGGVLHIPLSEDALKYLKETNSTTVTFENAPGDTEAAVKLEAVAPFTDPYAYLDLKGYASAVGAELPQAEDVNYVILKIRQQFCSNNWFELFYCSGSVTGATPGRSITVTFADGEDEWQYIMFDMSDLGRKWRGRINGFRLDYMLNAGSEGEAVYISELIFAKTLEQTYEFCPPSVPSETDPHALTEEEQKRAEELIKSAVSTLPEISDEPVTAEHEANDLYLWFDHGFAKTPAEETASNGKSTYVMRLGKNESELAELVLSSGTDREISLKVSDFVNGDSKITPEVFYGHYFDDVEGQSIVDPIPPLEGPISLTAGRSQMFLIKITADKNAASGLYTAAVEVLEDGRQIKKAAVYAYVWDFALPDAHKLKTLADLSWWSIYAADPQLYSGDDGLAYKNYYDTLLKNGINAYDMPYVGNAEYADAGDDELEWIKNYLNDPRVQAFNPIGFKNDPNGANVKAAYDFLSANEEWIKKAYFYTVDEPADKAALDLIREHADLIKSVWGDNYKLIIPMHLNSVMDREYKTDSFRYLKGYVNVWCPHNYFYNTYEDKQADPSLTYRGSSAVEKNLGSIRQRLEQAQAQGEEAWMYVTRYPHRPEIALSIDDSELDHRIMFWQQKLYNTDGFLYYSVNDWYGGGASQHNWGWDKKLEVDTGSITPYVFYGNGVLLYHGGYIGKLHECVESIRLEVIRDGLEDYDYFVMLDEKYGEGTSELLIKQITTSLGRYTSDAELFTTVRTAAGDLLANNPAKAPEPQQTEELTEPEQTQTENIGAVLTPRVVVISIVAAAVVAVAAAVIIIFIRKRAK